MAENEMTSNKNYPQIDIIREITDAWEKYTVSKENLNFYDKELLSNSKELLESSMTSLDKKEINITII